MARILQEFGEAGSTASIMLNGVRRDLEDGDPLAARLRRNAWMVGGHVLWRIAGGAYEVSLEGGLTGISGTKESILLAQHGRERYLQRPDADYVQVDSSRTSLSGAKATFSARKISGAHLALGRPRRPGVARGHLQRYRETRHRGWNRAGWVPHVPRDRAR